MYSMIPSVVIFSFDPRRATHCRHVTKIPSPQLLLFPPLTNRDARNSFRFRSYANCRVPSFQPKVFSSFEPFPNEPSNLPTFFLSDLSATPSETPPLFAEFCSCLSPFRINTSRSVDSKQLYLSSESTLMKNRGRGVGLLLT